jgi:hypothetical protein
LILAKNTERQKAQNGVFFDKITPVDRFYQSTLRVTRESKTIEDLGGRTAQLLLCCSCHSLRQMKAFSEIYAIMQSDLSFEED